MFWTSIVVYALSQATPQCEAPRARDTAPLIAAMAQDKVLALAFAKAAGVCVERGLACEQARLECSTLLSSTIQRQVAFDEGQWLRDMLLPYNGANYPMTRTFGQAALASDASCNVDVATLTAAGQRRAAQAARRDTLFQEYGLFTKWTEGEHQKCRDRLAEGDLKSAEARAEAERLAAAAAAVAATEALALKQAQEAAAAKALAEQEAKKQQEAERLAREEEERQKKLAEENARAEKEKYEGKAEEEKVTQRNAQLASQRAQKKQLVADAEAALKAARDEEALKKQAALDAVNSSPAIAQGAVAEAAQAERARIEAEKHLVDAQEKADAIEIDDSFERAAGSVMVAGGGSGTNAGFGLGLLAAAHFGFWGTAPLEGMASGFELRVWGRYSATLSTGSSVVDALLTARYFFGIVGVGLAGEVRSVIAPMAGAVRGGVGPAVSLALVDRRQLRILLGANYMPLGNTIDAARFQGDFELSWRFLTLHVLGGTANAAAVSWNLGAYIGLRASW